VTDEDAARIEDGVRATLPSSVQPWVVAASRGRSSAWSVELTHPASNGLVIESDGVSVRLVASNAEVIMPIEVTKLDNVLRPYQTVTDALGGSDEPR